MSNSRDYTDRDSVCDAVKKTMTESLRNSSIPLMDAAISIEAEPDKVKVDDFDKLMRVWGLKLGKNQQNLLLDTIERDKTNSELFRVDWFIDDLEDLTQNN